ncbi:MAG: patatin-like phospholipase family protein [Richelia sp. SM1_7_0]|nr:patatin-like phospholipase family protein [Richelia sp. SM1_7_0]
MSYQERENQKFKILALDGGGIRGVVTARILQEVQELIGKQPLNEYFDLIAGTSTGAIIAAGLAIGKKPEELREIYQQRGREIFNASSLRKIMALLHGSKYSNQGLIKVLQEELREEITLRQVSEISRAELLILAYDTFYRNTTFFTSKAEPNRWFNDMKLWEICTSSASAPTFFPPYEFTWIDPNHPENGEWKFPHVDGGVGANCPAMAALCHVMGERNYSIKDISILSIGTGRTTKPHEYKNMKEWGTLGWGKNIPDVFMGSQTQITTDTCQEIINAVNPNSYLRLQFDINQRFQQRKDSYQPRELLPAKEQINQFIHKKINEEMDDASQENIQNLLDAAELFAESEGKALKSL